MLQHVQQNMRIQWHRKDLAHANRLDPSNQTVERLLARQACLSMSENVIGSGLSDEFRGRKTRRPSPACSIEGRSTIRPPDTAFCRCENRHLLVRWRKKRNWLLPAPRAAPYCLAAPLMMSCRSESKTSPKRTRTNSSIEATCYSLAIHGLKG